MLKRVINGTMALLASGVVVSLLLLILIFKKIFPRKNPVGFFQKSLAPIVFLIFRYFGHFSVEGRENLKELKRSKPVLFVANHVGLIDAMIVVLAVPHRFRLLKFLGASWVWRDKILGPLVEAVGGVQLPETVIRPENCITESEWQKFKRRAKLAKAMECLQNDRVAGIFPQGAVTDPSLGIQGNMKVGAADLMLLIPDLTVVPIAVLGTWELIFNVKDGLTLNIQSIYDFVMRRRKLGARIGKPFTLADVDIPEADYDQRLKHISQKIAERIENVIKEGR